jgi:hypothetical protein
VRWAGAAIGTATVVGATASVSLQAVLALSLVAVVAVGHVRSRTLGLFLLWSLWFFAPFARRVVDLVENDPGPDLLALAPFLATLAVAAIDYHRRPLSGRAWLVPALVVGGLLIGVPSGLDDPLPLAYGMVAYVASVSGFFIGYAEPIDEREPPQLERVMLMVLPLVALYGIYQALFPLPQWDEQWLRTVDVVEFGSKQNDNFRAFSTLNAPGTLGTVLAVLAALCLAARRQTAYVAIVGALALACIAVTFVRSAWLGLVVAMVLVIVIGRGRYIARVLVLSTLVLAMVLVLGPRSTIGAQVIERASTLGSLGQDTSAQSRLDTTSAVIPVAIRQPIGAGLGVVGQARRLSDSPDGLNFPDNGYLAILYQTGPAGFLMVVGTLLWCMVSSLRARVGPEWNPLRVTCGVALGTLLFLEIGADVLYGVTGPMVFYFAGLLMRIAETSRGFGGR